MERASELERRRVLVHNLMHIISSLTSGPGMHATTSTYKAQIGGDTYNMHAACSGSLHDCIAYGS